MASTGKTNKITPIQRGQLRSIFDLFAVDSKLSEQNLPKIFNQVGYVPTAKQMQSFSTLFAKKPLISFDDFLSIFRLRPEECKNTKVEIMNAFRVI